MGTHVVVNKHHYRAHAGVRGADRFEVGQQITPTDAELSAFPDRFTKIPQPEPATEPVRRGPGRPPKTEVEVDGA